MEAIVVFILETIRTEPFALLGAVIGLAIGLLLALVWGWTALVAGGLAGVALGWSVDLYRG